VLGDGHVPLAPLGTEPLADGTKVTVGVRPEHLLIDAEGGEGTVTGTVRAVEWLGHERHIICDLDGTDVIVREPAEGTAPDTGSRVRLFAAPEHVHLFDPATTERIN
jgi:ABC-type sugar transport system ATPase subunit